MSRKILILFISLLSIYLSACRSDEPSATGADLLNSDLINLDSLDSYKDTLQQISSSHLASGTLSNSNMLLLGKNNLNEASTLLSFYFGMPDTLLSYISAGSLKVEKSFIKLYVNYKLGTPTPGFSFTAHKITDNWYTGFTIDSLASLGFEPGNVASNITLTENDSTVAFDVDTALVNSWLVAEASSAIPADNGILLTPQSVNGILGFHSITGLSDNVPTLYVVVSKEGWSSFDTLLFSPAIDLSVVKGSLPSGNSEDIFIQSGVFINSYLRFDFSKLPEHAIINYAELELTSDTTARVFGYTFTDALIASLLADSTKKDSGISNITLSRSGNLYKGNIAAFVQYWISTNTNNGMLLKAGAPLEGADLFAVKGSNAADPVKRPRLKIIYTNKK